ncbi:Concanavalin A-like lectin/glucanase [Cordyceps fumosorosea ARSEF 2679]|uniref:Concanavalin A-like lectin/glucanase n=1 Tax=Cordyceps fumosorosea (strain ARSEF 2679) TaxID=1081104 RepID=A0A167M2V5_CORFA|nr:Concanavalin A-like lectin/glucanase [Cordyceps fumosorosea ARSEF 2679]OAA53843.1 Concanavalin A-like lectin/glucanase [Cordyceps fumosorosea ARSEF 2679]
MYKPIVLTLASLSSILAAPLDNVTPAKHKRSYTSSNWSGAVQESKAGSYNYVQGSFVVPTLNDQNNPSGTADIWVGIDGNNCKSAILQTGIVTYGDGSFWVWTEWWKHTMQDYSVSLDVNGGDTIRLTVHATSSTSGTTSVENLTTGKSVSQTFTSETSYPLCESDAEWIVEDFSTDSQGDLAPLVDWGTIKFFDTTAKGPNGQVSAVGAEVFNLKQNGVILTDTEIGSDGSVSVTYTGGQ